MNKKSAATAILFFIIIFSLFFFTNHSHAVDDGACWVADTNNNQVVKLDNSGGVIVRVGGFKRPWAVSVNPIDGTCWVADTYHHQIVKLAPNGTQLLRIDGFWYPWVLSANIADGSCWVGGYNHQVVKLDANGTVLARTGGFKNTCSLSVNPTDGSCWVGDYDDNIITKLDSNGNIIFNQNYNFSPPLSVSVNSIDGTCWVGDYYNKAVKLNSNGNELLPSIQGIIKYPWSLSTNSVDRSFWAIDYENDQVVKMNTDDGKLLNQVSGFNRPYSLSVNTKDGSCWVADSLNNQVVKLDKDGVQRIRINGFNNPLSVSVNSGTGSTGNTPAEVAVFKYGTRPRIGRVMTYYIVIANLGDEPVNNISVVDTLPTQLNFLDCSPVGACTNNNNTITWDWKGNSQLKQLDGLKTVTFTITAMVPNDPVNIIGKTLFNTAEITEFVAPKDNPGNNEATYSSIGVGAYDPNEKGVSPQGYISTDQILSYFIHFENEGNAEAIDISVVDVLADQLDENQIYFISDNGKYDKQTKTITWSLQGINLPPKGGGVVSFIMKIKPELPVGTEIKNKASIFFDFNPPMETPEVISIIGSPEELRLQDVIQSMYAFKRDIQISELKNKQPFLAKLEAAIEKAEDGIAYLHDQQFNLADNMLQTSINQLTSLLNLISAQSGKELSEATGENWSLKIKTIKQDIETILASFVTTQ